MYRFARSFALLVPLAVLSSAGCYHAIVETGRPASDVVMEEKWAASFIHGLVPPDVVETASTCPNGVARVETRHSFLNQIVAALTFGIFTPMEIKVTCASGAPTPDAAPTPSGAAEKLQAAVERAADSGAAVLVRLSAE